MTGLLVALVVLQALSLLVQVAHHGMLANLLAAIKESSRLFP